MTARQLIQFILGLAILLAVFNFLGFREIAAIIKGTDAGILLFAVLIEFIILLIQAYRWKFLINTIGANPNFKNLFIIFMIGNFLNRTMPIGYSGEPVRAYLLKKTEKISLTKGMATIASERVFDVIALLVLAIFGFSSMLLAYKIPGAAINVLVPVILGIALSLALAMGVLWRKDVVAKLLHAFFSILFRLPFRGVEQKLMKIDENLDKHVSTFHQSFFAGYMQRKSLLTIGTVTALRWLLAVGRTYLVFAALNFTVSMFVVAAVISAATLIRILPTPPGGLGVIEAAMILIFTSAGIPSELSAAATLLDRVVGFWLVVFVGWMFSLLWKVR